MNIADLPSEEKENKEIPFEELEYLLPGWPGYRTRPGRSGFDYIDTQIEVAHMTGVFIRRFFSGEWIRSRGETHPLAELWVGLGMISSGWGAFALVVGMLVKLFRPLIYWISLPPSSISEEDSGDHDETDRQE